MEDYAGVSERMVKKATALGAQDAVADIYLNRNYQVRFSQNQVDISNKWRNIAGWLFVAVDRRLVFTEINDFSRADKVVENTVKVARKSQENPEYGGIAAGPFRYRASKPDRKITELEDGGDLVQAGIQSAVKAGAKETAGVFWRYDEEHFLPTSGGVSATRRGANLYFSLRALRSLEESGHGVECATRFADFHPERAGEKAGGVAEGGKKRGRRWGGAVAAQRDRGEGRPEDVPPQHEHGEAVQHADDRERGPRRAGIERARPGARGPHEGGALRAGAGRALRHEHLVHALPVLRDRG